MSDLFTLPPAEAMARGSSGYTYALFNYYGSGPIPAAKRARFSKALWLLRDTFGGAVIDMGCADGVLLPSLCRHYKRVVAVDICAEMLDQARHMARNLSLPVTFIHSEGMAWAELRERIGGGFNAMTCLETMEHVGRQPDPWGSKAKFAAGALSLLEPCGKMVVSVPKMVGPMFLVKQCIQRVKGPYHDRMSVGQMLRSAFLYDTSALEPLWNGGHVGFNHMKMEAALSPRVEIVERRQSLIAMFYVLRKADSH